MKAIKRETKYLLGDDEQEHRVKFSDQSLNKGAIDRLLQLAQPEVAVDDDKLDQDPYLLNVPNGTIDLRTGRLEQHDPADLITRLCPTMYSRKSECKQFKQFLRHATDGNKNFMRFLQKAVGYSLTGSAAEQVLFFLHGPTRTGKSTLVNLIRDIVGDYGIHTPTSSLLVKHFDGAIPVDIARMKGARIVTAIESNASQQLDEAKIKSMTGGDKQVARFMRQNLFEFTPEFKLWFAANDMPRVRATDDAIWDRIVVLPFKAQVAAENDDNASVESPPGAKRDKNLPVKLRAEASGILAWAVKGALLWGKEGLTDKSQFDFEKNNWRKQSDTVGRFFHECCQVVAATEHVQSAVLYARYKHWCVANSEQPSSDRVLKARLIELGVAPKKTKAHTIWLGIRLIEGSD
jgi:putative DNA primase/helicase